MLSASSQLQDSIVKFSDLGKWPRGTAQCPNLVHAAAPHKKVHLWCPTCHNGINSLPSVVILKPVLPIRDKTWEIFHISMSGGVLISQSFFVVWSQANAFFTISGQRWDFARLMYLLIDLFSNFYVSKLCQKVGLETNLVQIDPGARLLLFGQRLVFQDFIFKQTHKKGRWILFSLFWIVFSSIITSVNPSFSSLWRKLFTPSRNNNKIYSRDTGRSHWESFHHLLRKLRLEFWETHFHICKFSLNIWIVDYLNICKFSLNRVPLGHTLDPC